MQHRLHILRLIYIFSILILLPSCSKAPKYRIGVSQCSNDDWRRKMNEEISREAMFHDNVEFEIRSADDDNQRQIDDLQYFVDNDFDIIVVAPNEAEALTPKIKEIYESGKPVLLFDRMILGDSYTAYQGADNVEIGSLAANLAATYAPSGKVIEILGRQGSSPAVDRANGFLKGANDIGLHIMGSGRGNWDYDKGRQTADSLLSLYPDVDVIFAHNDRMAMGAADAVKAHGLNGIKVIGIDAAPTIGMQAVADSIIDATFLYPTGGEQLIKTALAILKGEPYTRNLMLPTAAAVDRTNAGILLLQDAAMREETQKVNTLQSRIAQFWEAHTLQTTLLYGLIIILVLIAGLLFTVLRTYWAHKRHRQEVEAKNHQLESQRDQLAAQRDQLAEQRDQLAAQRDQLATQRDELDTLYTQLQTATASKLTFFTNVSHDLRTPLTLIADPVEQLAEATNLTAQQHTMAQLANKNVKILIRLINQILDFRKYENGKLDLHLTQVDMAKEVEDWGQSFSPAAKKRHVNFSIDITPDKDYRTSIDTGKMERVLYNLLSNAFKFTPDNGSISLSLDADTSNIYMQVTDTGSGMTTEDIKHVFERFYMVDRLNPQGSGIGLAVSKAFVELHGGSIDVQSQPGAGTTFTVTLPKHIADGSETQAHDHISAETVTTELTDVETLDTEIDENSRTILVIDDNPDICTLISGLLSDKYTVLKANNGTLGVKLALKYVPDLIICDVMMPGIDGMETCRRIKQEMATSHIPVLMLTACALDEQRIQGYDCGADGYLTKPFNSRVLAAQCESLIANRRLVLTAAGKEPAKGADTSAAKPTTTNASLDNEFYRRFAAIVEREISNSDISIEDVASELGLSRAQIYRKLKAITNYSPSDLIRNLRLQRADRLLKSTEQNVSEIAYAVGFTSPSYFTKCYRDYYGEAPTEVQRRTSKQR